MTTKAEVLQAVRALWGRPSRYRRALGAMWLLQGCAGALLGAGLSMVTGAPGGPPVARRLSAIKTLAQGCTVAASLYVGFDAVFLRDTAARGQLREPQAGHFARAFVRSWWADVALGAGMLALGCGAAYAGLCGASLVFPWAALQTAQGAKLLWEMHAFNAYKSNLRPSPDDAPADWQRDYASTAVGLNFCMMYAEQNVGVAVRAVAQHLVRAALHRPAIATQAPHIALATILAATTLAYVTKTTAFASQHTLGSI